MKRARKIFNPATSSKPDQMAKFIAIMSIIFVTFMALLPFDRLANLLY